MSVAGRAHLVWLASVVRTEVFPAAANFGVGCLRIRYHAI